MDKIQQINVTINHLKSKIENVRTAQITSNSNEARKKTITAVEPKRNVSDISATKKCEMKPADKKGSFESVKTDAPKEERKQNSQTRAPRSFAKKLSSKPSRPKIPILKLNLKAIFKSKKHKKQKKLKTLSMENHIQTVECLNEVSVEKPILTIIKEENLIVHKEALCIAKYNLKECSVKLMRLETSREALATLSNVSTAATIENISEQTLIAPEDIKMEIEIEEELLKEVNMEIKEENPQPRQVVRKPISHMFYTITGSDLTFHCKLCTFSCITKHLFQRHIAGQHKSARWFGSCQSCGSRDPPNIKTLTEELEHMVVLHILKETIKIANLPTQTPVVRHYTNDGKEHPMVSIPSILLPQPAKKVEPESNIPILLDAIATTKKLRPWMHSCKSNHQKKSDASTDQLKFWCLSALYKCMSSTCDFFTNDAALFNKHLNIHSRHQSSDFDNFSNCPYCEYKGQKIDELVDHITDTHGKDQWQCNYCFYRSYDLQIKIHQSMYHTMKKPHVIKCQAVIESNEDNELSNIWKNVRQNVPIMTCMSKFKMHVNCNDFLILFFNSLQSCICAF